MEIVMTSMQGAVLIEVEKDETMSRRPKLPRPPMEAIDIMRD